MNILERIKTDLTFARKAKDAGKVSILSTLFAEVEKVGKDKKNRATTDEEAIQVIKKFSVNAQECIKLHTDCRPEYDKMKDMGSAADNRIRDLETEVNIYNFYLPLQMDEAELKRKISEMNLEGKPVGMIMAEFKRNYPGQYDGKLLSDVAKKFMDPATAKIN